MAIVGATDGEALEAVSRLPADRLASVVVLRGFDPQKEADVAPAALKNVGVPVVTCVPGGIQQALDDLARAGVLGERQVAGIR